MVDLFATPEWDERLQLVLHLLNSTEKTPYVRGPAGAGKSSFGALLTGRLDVGVEFLWLRAAADTDLARQAEQLHVAHPVDPGDTLDLLPGPVLLIDDAHRLPRAQLETLPGIRREGVRAVLFGEPVADWDEAAFNLQYVDLPPFTEEQLSGLLTHLGFPAVPAADQASLREASDGYPGRLVRHLERLQRDAASASTQSPQPRASLRPLRWGFALVAVTALALVLLRGDWWSSSEAPAPAPAGPPVAGVPEPTEPYRRELAESAPESGSSTLAVVEPTIEPKKGQTISKQSLTASDTRSVDDAPEGYDAWAMTPVPPDDLRFEQIRFAASRPAAPVRLDEKGVAPDESRPAATPSSPSPDTPAAPAATLAPEPPFPAAPVVDAAPSPASNRPAPVVKAPPQSRVPAATLSPESRRWLRERDPRHYTLQLVGARERSAVVEFAKKYGIGADHAIFKRDLNGKPWYSLVTGDYPDRVVALAARSQLPPKLRDTAWPRTFQSIFDQLAPAR